MVKQVGSLYSVPMHNPPTSTTTPDYSTWTTGALMVELARLNRKLNQSMPEAAVIATARERAAVDAEIASR